MSDMDELVGLVDRWYKDSDRCADHSLKVGSDPITSAQVFNRCASQLLAVLKRIHKRSPQREGEPEMGEPVNSDSVESYEITFKSTDLIPNGNGARIGYSDALPGRVFLLLPDARSFQGGPDGAEGIEKP